MILSGHKNGSTMNSKLITAENGGELTSLIKSRLQQVREDLRDNSYLDEAIRVLPVQGYRSAIGSIWNAVIDDLRNKIMYRSLELFNKEIKPRQEIKKYEDFQSFVNDDDLIDGAYKLGIIGWEASKILKHAKETRHIFDGHPRSDPPSVFKVLAMLDDCIKYVLSVEFPQKLIDISEFIVKLDDVSFDRNAYVIENALSEIPDGYKTELVNRLLRGYVNKNSSSTLISNIEFVAPILWKVLGKQDKTQVIRSIDQIINKNDVSDTERAFEFVEKVNGYSYLSQFSRNYWVKPILDKLANNADDYDVENIEIPKLEKMSGHIPRDLTSQYVRVITRAFIGKIGHSYRFSRTDWYSDRGNYLIPSMFEKFDDNMIEEFIEYVKEDKTIRSRISDPNKMRRLRQLGNIALEKASMTHPKLKVIESLCSEEKEEEFWKFMKSK